MKKFVALLLIAVMVATAVTHVRAITLPEVQKVGTVNLGDGAEGETILINGDRMYVFGGKKVKLVGEDEVVNAVWCFSLKDPANPKLLGVWSPAEIENIHATETIDSPIIAYKNFVVITHDPGLHIIDFSNPKNPTSKMLARDESAVGATFYKHYLIETTVDNQLKYFDISNDFKEHTVNLPEAEIYPLFVFAINDMLYISGGETLVFDISHFPEIKFIKEIKDINGDELNVDTARMFGKYIICGRGLNGYDLIDGESAEYNYASVEGLSNTGLDKFAKDGRTLYAIANVGKTLVAMDAIDIAHPKFLYKKDLQKKAEDIGVYMGYIYLVNDGTIDILNSAPFKDVSTDYWAINAIKYMVSKNIISGYPDNTFKPEKIVTRAEYAKMLALSLNLDVSKGRDIYSDVPNTHWAYKYITAVTDAKLMKGYGKGKFGPNDTVKKEEIITTIVRLKKWTLINPDKGTFPDVPKKYWAYPYIETAVKNGLIKKVDKGLTDGNFHIKMGATRAQTAELLYRAIKNSD